MIAALTQLAQQGQGWIWDAAIVFFRVGAAMALMPGVGEQAIPGRIRLVLALGFTAVVLPAVQPGLPHVQGLGLALPLLTETVIGLALGAVLRLFIFALQIGGTMIAQATSLAQFFGGAGAEPQPAAAHLLMVSGFALAFATGLHVRLAQALILSYHALPAGRFPDAAMLSRWGVAEMSHAFALAFTLAAPFVAAALLYNVALGVINKAMPQLMVVFVGAPALTLGGLVLLLFVAPAALTLWLHGLTLFLQDPFRLVP